MPLHVQAVLEDGQRGVHLGLLSFQNWLQSQGSYLTLMMPCIDGSLA